MTTEQLTKNKYDIHKPTTTTELQQGARFGTGTLRLWRG